MIDFESLYCKFYDINPPKDFEGVVMHHENCGGNWIYSYKFFIKTNIWREREIKISDIKVKPWGKYISVYREKSDLYNFKYAMSSMTGDYNIIGITNEESKKYQYPFFPWTQETQPFTDRYPHFASTEGCQSGILTINWARKDVVDALSHSLCFNFVHYTSSRLLNEKCYEVVTISIQNKIYQAMMDWKRVNL